MRTHILKKHSMFLCCEIIAPETKIQEWSNTEENNNQEKNNNVTETSYLQLQSKENHKDFFGRRRGRPLCYEKEQYLHHVQDLHPSRWHPWPSNVILDIGFGYGEHFLHSLCHDDNNHSYYLGIEVFQNALAHVVSQIPKTHEHRCSIIPQPIQQCWPHIHSLQEVRILFPDPWPKKRHQKRRLVQEDFLQRISALLVPSGKLVVASDHMDLLHFMTKTIEKTNLFIQTEGWNCHHIENILQHFDIVDHWGNLHPKEPEYKAPLNNEDSPVIDPLTSGPLWPWVLTRYGKKAKKAGRPLGWSIWQKSPNVSIEI